MLNENNYLKIYRNSVFDLAETLIIKSSFTARRINELLKYTHPGSFTDDPRTWKYYLNISGQYHSSDRVMEVISLDTLEPIVFSSENLLLHRATRRAYDYGTRHYNELVAKYPKQEDLILGILYPTDIDKAINAKDYTILSYPEYLIEPNEYTLIRDLNHWIDGFKSRWYNQAFNITDDLYEAAFLGVLGPRLVEAIFLLRLKRIRSDEVHSFFVNSYLASNGRLDRYLNVLTFKQKLFLYRNLPWIIRNTGRSESYDWLIERLLTERYVPLQAYAMDHDVSEITETIVGQTRFLPSARNFVVSTADLKPNSLSTILYKEDPLAPDNPEVRKFDEEVIDLSFQDSISSKVQTKVLESIVTDYSGSETYSFEDILVNHWVYFSSSGIFNSFVQIVNPRTGASEPLSAKDTFVLCLYLLLTIEGYQPSYIPPITVSRVQRIIKPTLKELQSVVESRLVSDETLREIIDQSPAIVPVISIDAFHEKCFEIFLANQYTQILASNANHLDTRAYIQNASALMYGTKECLVSDYEGQTFAEWFDVRKIEIRDYLSEPEENYRDIVNKALGLDLSQVTSIRDIQSGMLEILKQFSSYSIQVVKTVNETNIRPLNTPDLRIGDLDTTASGELGLIQTQPEEYDLTAKGYIEFREEVRPDADPTRLDAWFEDELCVPIKDTFEFDGLGNKITFDLNHGMDVLPLPYEDTRFSTVVPVSGIHLYEELTDTQRSQVPDVALENYLKGNA